MPLILPGNVASAVAGAYEVANSCRFNDGDSAYMHKTPGSGSNEKTWTLSFWYKRGVLSDSNQVVFSFAESGGSNPRGHIEFDTNFKLKIGSNPAGDWTNLLTDMVFRDVTAWYHIVVATDTTQGTEANRIKVYVNGTQLSDFSGTYWGENVDTGFNTAFQHTIGREENSDSNYLDGYLAEVCWIDGSALSPTSFGEFDEDSPTIWKPIDVSGLTFGTNGFYLDFEASDNLGNDANGGTDLTEANLAATDQMTDTPTNNYATLNPLMVPAANQPTFSEGNLKSVTNTTSGEYGWGGATTIGVTSGKWYCEALATVSGTSRSGIGVHYDPAEGARDNSYSVNEDYAWGYHSETGVLENDNATVWDGNAYVTDDIIGIYLDLDNHKLYIAKNGTLENSGTGASLTTGKTYFFYQEDLTGGTDHSTFEFNFGAGTSWTVSSGNADANGYGNFEYDPSAGSFDSASKDFYALNTKNLAEFG